MKVTLDIPSEAYEALVEEARTQNSSVEALLIRRALLPSSPLPFYRSELDSKLAGEEAAFEAIRAELWKRYPYQYVALQGGIVVDRDADYWTLVERMRVLYPDDVAVLIEQVRPEAPPELQLRSALWIRNRDDEL